jgi:hypothetical protein
MIAATLLDDGRRVRLEWPDGVSREVAARWLFDHADEARDPVSGQRGHGALTLDAAGALADAVVEGEMLRLRFAGSNDWRAIAPQRLLAAAPSPERTLWLSPDAMAEADPVAFADYLEDDGALREALSRLARYGLTLLDGAGREPGAVERAVARFGFVRETNYGRLFDVRIEPDPNNLAYSDQALDLHTDNPYRDPPPTLQLLHAITADADGGETMFVDGFAHAEALHTDDPNAFETLARTPARFSYAEASGARWSHTAPVLTLAADGAVETVRLNHRSMDLAPGDPAAMDAWYDAYLAFYRRLHAPDSAFGRRLAPGEMVIFDNRRLLHGRRGLSGGSPRWLQGCYADVDGLKATLARLEAADAD